MTTATLINGETVTSTQLSRWRHEFGGAFVDPHGCLLLCAGDPCNWHVLNAHTAFGERNDAYTGDMPNGLGGFVGRGATVQEFIAAARRLKAQREARHERDAWEREQIEVARAEQRRMERACASAIDFNTP